jgi:hypothetical protein
MTNLNDLNRMLAKAIAYKRDGKRREAKECVAVWVEMVSEHMDDLVAAAERMLAFADAEDEAELPVPADVDLPDWLTS